MREGLGEEVNRSGSASQCKSVQTFAKLLWVRCTWHAAMLCFKRASASRKSICLEIELIFTMHTKLFGKRAYWCF